MSEAVNLAAGRVNVVPREARFHVFMRPPRRPSPGIDGCRVARYLIAFTASVLIHYSKDAMDLIGVSGIENHVNGDIGGRIIEVGNRIRRVANDVGTEKIRWRSWIRVCDAISSPLIRRPVARRIMDDTHRIDRTIVGATKEKKRRMSLNISSVAFGIIYIPRACSIRYMPNWPVSCGRCTEFLQACMSTVPRVQPDKSIVMPKT
jgi:hypothetical protein